MQKQIGISVLIIFISFFIIFLSIKDFVMKENETKNYHETICEILEFERVEQYRGGKKLILTYTFEVEGRKYFSSKFSNGVGEVNDFEKLYPLENKFKVYYNPKNPSESVLVLGGRRYFWNGAMVLGVILLIIGAIGFLSIKSNFFRSLWEDISG